MADLPLDAQRRLRSARRAAGGWGRFPRTTMSIWRPESPEDAAALLLSADGPLLPVGGLRSYGDQALLTGGGAIGMRRLNRFLALDTAAPAVECEAGVTFGELLEVLAPHGLGVPVSPGTRFVTLGGAIANDVHGKNHDRFGAIGTHLDWIDLLLVSGEVRRLTPSGTPELFAATLGGCGLTGPILRARLRLQRTSQAVEVRYSRHGDLQALMTALAEARNAASYSVAWLDALAGGTRLGRGVLETAEPAAGSDMPYAAGRRLSLPFDLPGGLLNRWSIGAFNALYYRRIPAGGQTRRLPLAEFLYPLDSIGGWNRLYGRGGFHQFQCVLPEATAPRGLARMLERVSASGRASFLAVLKTLGAEGAGYLSFPRPGFTLALDIPHRPGSLELLAGLERLTLEHEGRVYLAKDSALSAQSVPAMYPRLAAFRRVLAEVDPEARLQSDMARRLDLRGHG